jgi:DNA-binding ferritin-like protein (Dps family)
LLLIRKKPWINSSVLGDDIKGFCSAIVGKEGAKSFRGKWREQLNNSIAKKLGK